MNDARQNAAHVLSLLSGVQNEKKRKVPMMTGNDLAEESCGSSSGVQVISSVPMNEPNGNVARAKRARMRRKDKELSDLIHDEEKANNRVKTKQLVVGGTRQFALEDVDAMRAKICKPENFSGDMMPISLCATIQSFCEKLCLKEAFVAIKQSLNWLATRTSAVVDQDAAICRFDTLDTAMGQWQRRCLIAVHRVVAEDAGVPSFGLSTHHWRVVAHTLAVLFGFKFYRSFALAAQWRKCRHGYCGTGPTYMFLFPGQQLAEIQVPQLTKWLHTEVHPNQLNQPVSSYFQLARALVGEELACLYELSDEVDEIYNVLRSLEVAPQFSDEYIRALATLVHFGEMPE